MNDSCFYKYKKISFENKKKKKYEFGKKIDPII